MKCHFCIMPVEPDGDKPNVCVACLKLLQNPATALPLIRGHLTLSLRGKLPEADIKRRINSFMEEISTWKRPG